MANKYFLRIFLVFLLVFQLFNKAGAQNYAIGGTAGADLTKSVYWLTWDPTVPGSTLISAPASSDANHITNGTYVWQYSPTVRITAVMSNQTFTDAITLIPYTPGNFTGDGLDLLYSGNNLPKPASRGVAGSALATTGKSTATFDIDVKVAILINGVYTNVNYPGMVIADAESIDSDGEYISGETPNPVAWQLLNKRVQGNASDDHYLMDLSNGGRAFRLRADLAPGNFGVQAVMFARGARNLTNLSMYGSGITAMAIGFVLPFDLGDGPASYGATGHYIDNFAITNVFTGDGTYPVVNYPVTPLVPQANVYIGANNVDADGNQVFSATANDDDNTGNNDESTITPSALPDLKVNQPGNYAITLPVTNAKNVPATLYGWIDFNRDGVFGADEVISVPVPANTTNQNITLTYPNALFAGKIRAGLLYSRFRITTTSLIDDPATTTDERSTAFAADGEAEDYNLKSILGLSITGTVRNDANGNLDNIISGPGVGTVAGAQLYAYLVGNNVVLDKVTVAANGTYSFAGANNGTYTVAISTNSVAIGSSLAAVTANLPSSWIPSGEAYGSNNAAGTGIEPGVPNLQITVSTPGTSLDISGLDFGLDQTPVAVTDNVNATAGQASAISVLANDSDPDGTVDITSVRLIDPADNTAKTTVTIPNQGTYVVNTTTGVVTFTPLVTFAGAATPVRYTIRDNFGAPSASNVIATITATVRPTGTPDSDVTLVNTAVTTNVKANDGAANATAVVTATNGTNGTTTVTPGGQITYTPNNGFIGTDTYTYRLTNGSLVSDPITVTITVSATPIGVNDTDTTPIATAVTTSVLANDGSFGTGSTVAIGSGPAHGAVVVNANGTVTYTPVLTYTGIDTYTYTITKSGSTSAPITVTISVVPVGVTDNYFTNVNSAISSTVKDNDGNSATGTTVTNVTAPAHGTTSVNNNVVTYTPTANYMGTDSYTYTLRTADGVVSAPITANVTIRPVGTPDAAVTAAATPVQTTVIGNDGISGIGSTVAATNGANGTTTVNGGVVTYTPNPGFAGIDSYTYTLTNNGATSLPVTVTVTVGSAPVGSPDQVVTNINSAATTDVRANDNNGAASTVTAGTAPAHGAIVVNANNTITYTPTNNYIGIDTYTYILNRNGVQSNPITVTVNIRPVGVNDVDVTNINTVKPITVKTNDNASANGTLVTANQPAHGTTTVSPTGVVTYTPANNYIGLDSFTYILTTADGVASAAITVNLSVKPVGVPDAMAIQPGIATQIPVKVNDGNSGTGTTVTATNPLHGTVTVSPAGVVTYTPTAGYTGTDSFTYTLTTPDGVASDPITVSLNVGSTIPVGTADTFTAPINTVITATVVDNDADRVGATLNAGSQAPSHGTIVVNANNTITYTPNANYVGLDSFTYTLTKNGQTSTQILVTIGMIPVGVTDAASTTANTAATINVKGNDGPSAGTTTVRLSAIPTNGTATVNAAGNIVYTPNPGFTGTDVLTYILSTADGVDSDPIVVNITVGNALPTGVADEVTTSITTAINITQLANDPSATPATTVTLGTTPAHGTVVLNANRTITYTPVATYTGKDTFTYTITEGGQTSLPITVTVNIKPVAVADAVFASVGTPLTITVKANDGNSAAGNTVSVVTNPTNGTVTVNANGQVIYTPNVGYIGADSFTYRLTTPDGVASDPVTVNINVTNSPGVADADSTPYNTAVTTAVKANDGAGSATSTVTATNGSHGTTIVNANGTVTYTPSNYVGLDTYTYTLTTVPGGVVSNPISVTISVKPVGVFDGASTPINEPVITVVKNNDGPSAAGTTVIATNGAHGTTIVNADGSITYTPATNYTGSDTYTYTLRTPDGVLSDPITVTVSVKLVGTADNIATLVNVPVSFAVKANDGVSGNGAIVTPTNGLHGTTSVNAAGVVTYTPANNYIGLDSYTYTLSIPGSVSDPIRVTVSIKPIGANDVAATDIGTPVTTNVRANDGPLAANTTVVPANGQNGTTTVDAKGLVTYTPAAGYIGLDTYTYTLVTADGVASDPITVSVTVRPAGIPDVYTTDMNVAINNPNLQNDGSSVTNSTVSLVSQPANGTAVLNANNTVTYTPAPGFVGVDTYTYRLTNNGINSTPILVTINVRAAGVPDVSSTPVNTTVLINVKANDGTAATSATVTIASAPTQGGTVTVNAAGQVIYTPATDFVGVDTFTYTLNVGGAISGPINVSVTVYRNAITLTKVATNTVTKAGDVINYTIVVGNNGTAILTNVVVTDARADVGSITPSTIAILPAGTTATVTAKHTVTQAEVDNGSFSNQASVTARDPQNNVINGPLSDDPSTTAVVGDPTVSAIAAAPAIKLTKTGVATATDITYTFVFENTGNTTLTTVTLTDIKLGLNQLVIALPAGGLAPGATFSYTHSPAYVLTQADKDAGSVQNSAIATGTDGKGNTAPSTGPTGSTTTPIPKAPKAVDDIAPRNGNSPVTVNVLANDEAGTSPLDPATVITVIQPSNGAVTVNSDGTITYTPNVGYTGPDAFTYKVKDGNGVYTNDATVNIVGSGIPLTPPTLFTPNGDGVNDTFEIRGLNAFPINDITITNRWGNAVYRSNGNYQNNWTGEGLNEGTYYYVLRVKVSTGDNYQTVKGWVTLLRTFKK